ncbi:MAG: M23 family metallopeptidase [Calditrichia bacterium]
MRKKPQFVYIDPSTSKIKQINISFPKIVISISLFVLVVLFALKISFDYVIQFGYNSQIVELKKENSILLKQMKKMDEKISGIRTQINQIEEVDDHIRATLDVPLIDDDVRQVGIGGSDISPLEVSNLKDPELKSSMANLELMIDRLERELKLEIESYQSLAVTMERKEDSLRYLPAIKPVPNGRVTDVFGNRRHPIFKRIMPHYGLDLAADRGTPILATADGYVKFTGRNGGYGMFVSINHKYGYQTRYGHMQKIYVHKGQFVKRGDKIGEVGNTGISTAPHLHYEVLYHDEAKNPQNYYFNDILFE